MNQDKLISRAMSALGKRRWKGTSKAQRQKALAAARAVRDADPEARKAVGKRLAEARARKRLSQ